MVYPRVGGETTLGVRADSHERGLSPRGRGNLPKRRVVEHGYGSIPAWAGKPSSRRLVGAASGVYPRVGGETPAFWA